jgi:hypothetical protein
LALPRVFVEVAGVEGDLATIMRTLPLATDGAVPSQGFDPLVHDTGIKSVSVHHVLTKNDTLETLLWDFEQLDSAGKTQRVRWDMKLTPHVVTSSPVSVRLEVTLLSAPLNDVPSDASPADPTLAQTTLVVRDQQTIVLGGFGERKPAPRTVFAVTPYVVWEEADMQRLYECKLRSRRATH